MTRNETQFWRDSPFQLSLVNIIISEYNNHGGWLFTLHLLVWTEHCQAKLLGVGGRITGNSDKDYFIHANNENKNKIVKRKQCIHERKISF